MNWRQLWNAGKQLITRGIQQIETKVKEWTKPAPDRQITGVCFPPNNHDPLVDQTAGPDIC